MDNNYSNNDSNNVTFIIPTIGRETLQRSINSLLNQTINNWFAIIIFDGIKSNINITDDRIKIVEIEKMGININSAGNVRNYGISIAKTKWIAFLDDDDTIADDYISTFHNELKIFLNIDIDIDLIIFRMKMVENQVLDSERANVMKESKSRIIPKNDTDNFYICDVGISFIMKKEIFDNGIKFIPDGAEDFLYLNTIRYSTRCGRDNIIQQCTGDSIARCTVGLQKSEFDEEVQWINSNKINNRYKMTISPYIKYFVRSEPENITNNLGNRVFINGYFHSKYFFTPSTRCRIPMKDSNHNMKLPSNYQFF